MRLQRFERSSLGQGANASLAIGVLLILLGAFAIGGAITATIATVVLFGWLMLAAGILQMAQVTVTRGWGTALNVMVGVLYAVVGLLMISRPAVGAAGITLMLAAFFLVVGVMRIITAVSVRYDNWGWSIFAGAAAIVLAIMIWSGWPESGVWLIGTLLGIELMMWGMSLTLMALGTRRALRHARRRGEVGLREERHEEERPSLH